MDVALRSHITAGIALVGAGMLVAAPLAPVSAIPQLPEVQVPAVELLTNPGWGDPTAPFEVLGALMSNTGNNLGSLTVNWFTNTLPELTSPPNLAQFVSDWPFTASQMIGALLGPGAGAGSGVIDVVTNLVTHVLDPLGELNILISAPAYIADTFLNFNQDLFGLFDLSGLLAPGGLIDMIINEIPQLLLNLI